MEFRNLEPIGYPNYSVSENGDVRNESRDRIVKPTHNQKGYRYIQLYDGTGRRTNMSVGRVVAEMFVANERPGFWTYVIHKDYDLNNCNYTNLEWRSRQYAMRYHKQNRLAHTKMYAQPIMATDIRDSYLPLRFGSVADAAEHYGLLHTEILMSAHNQETTNIYPWLQFAFL